MKTILVRGGADPFRHYLPRDLLKKDSLGANSGNLMFSYGTMNALTTSDVKCVSTLYKKKWTAAEIDEINQTCSAFVLPLADAFRADFIWELNVYAKLIRQLKIPCIVNGIGLRANYEPDPGFSFPFNDSVKRFVSEVLDHSAKLGLRGEITGDYLKTLGFVPERDYTVIGCPSMYMHGLLHEDTGPKNDGLAVSLNGLVPEKTERFYLELMESNGNTHIIQQRTSELMDLYYGRKVDLSTTPQEFARRNIFDSFDFKSMKAGGHVQFFTDIPNWIHYLKQFPLFVGARFHGTVAALLAGVPSIITPFDSRTRELAAYHQIPAITEKDLEKEIALNSLPEHADFGKVARAHESNFAHYKDFLKCNGLSSIFDEKDDLPFGQSPMEKKGFGDWKPSALLSAYETCGVPEKIARTAEYKWVKGVKKVRRRMKKGKANTRS